jgi:hypothetical protein
MRRAFAFAPLMCVTLGTPGRFVGAQETHAAVDSATRSPVPGIWASAGLGLSNKDGASWLAGLNYSPGIALISIDAAGSDLFSNDDVQVRAVMLGLRSHESGGMASASLGLARAHRAGGCGDCGATTPGPTASALAFSAAAHANRFGIGFALGTFGVAGPPEVRDVSFLLSLEAGWFGEARQSSAGNLLAPETRAGVVVDDTDCLHPGVDDRWAHELEPAALHLL